MFVDEAGVTKIARIVKSNFVAQEAGKGLSSNYFTDALKTKLENLTSIFRFKGIVATVQDLPTTADDGDIYGVGTAQTGFTGYIWFTGQFHEWETIDPNSIDYATLMNKPSIGGVELIGDKTATELNLVDTSTFTTALNNKIDSPATIGQANTVLICNADGSLEWGSIGGISSGNQTINGTVTVNVTASSGIACWILNRNNTTAGFIEMKYSNTRTCVIGKGGSNTNIIYFQTYANYDLHIKSDGVLNLQGDSISLSVLPTCTTAPTANNQVIRKIDIKNLVAGATDWASFQQTVASW